MASVLDQYAQGAAERLGGPTFCSLIIKDGQTLRQVASNDPRAAACDQVETRDGDGPCIVAIDQLHSVLLPDIDADHQWPNWREAALANGFRAFIALPAYVDDDVSVAVNVYSEEMTAWSRTEILALDTYVQQLATALGSITES